MQGATETSSYEKFRQSNQFYYLTGVETPRAILVIDGRARSTTLYLDPTNEQMEHPKGRCSSRRRCERSPASSTCCRAATSTRSRVSADARSTLPFRGETVLMGTPDRAKSHAQAREADPWDQEPSREAWFKTKLSAKAPGVEVREPRRILDEMRKIKSPREIALLRESSKIAGLGDDGGDALGRAGHVRIRNRGDRRLHLQEEQRHGPGLLRAGRRRKELRVAALSRRAGADEGRRSGAVRLRARLPLLHVRRDPHVPGERQIHRRPARALRHLREALSTRS